MMPSGFSAVVVACALALAPLLRPGPAAQAQSSRDTLSGTIVEASEIDVAQATPSGLPRRTSVPRTMEAHWPVFAAFAVSWVGIVSYMVITGRRNGRLSRRLREMEERR